VAELYIITGSNGAGKSTVGGDYLPKEIQTQYSIFDGDKLFMQKRKELFGTVTKSHKEARNLAYEWLVQEFESLVEEALNNRQTFVYEGHFTNDSTWDVPKRFKANGYTLNLIFFGLSNPDLSELRVIDRAKEGGHYVPRFEIESNFFGNLKKLDQYFDILDTLNVVDTSETEHTLLFSMTNGNVTFCLPYDKLPNWVHQHLPRISEKIRNHGIS